MYSGHQSISILSCLSSLCYTETLLKTQENFITMKTSSTFLFLRSLPLRGDYSRVSMISVYCNIKR